MDTIERSRREHEELFLYLKDNFGDDMDIAVSKSISSSCYEITGKYKSNMLVITYDKLEKKLLFSTNIGNKTFFEKIAPFITVFMDGYGPICKYLVAYSGGKVVKSVIEWGEDVDKRIEELNRLKIFPFVIRDMTPLVETKKMRDKRLGFSSLNPIFFPNSNVSDLSKLKKMVESYNEQDCFLALKVLSSISYQFANNTWSGSCPDLSNIYVACGIIKNRAYQLVGHNYLSATDFAESVDYKTWFLNWDDYFTYDKKCQYMEKRINGEDVSDFNLDGAKRRKIAQKN